MRFALVSDHLLLATTKPLHFGWSLTGNSTIVDVRVPASSAFQVLPYLSPSSETQGQSVGPGEKARRKFSSTGPFPNGQANAGSWLATKNALYYCAQSANSISWVLFGEFVHDGYWLDYGLSGSYTKEMHAAVRKLSVWYKLSGIIKILSTRRLKTLFQKYKPALTKGIHAFIDHASVNIIPTSLLCQMQANSSGTEFLSTISKFIKRNIILSLLVYVLHKTWN